MAIMEEERKQTIIQNKEDEEEIKITQNLQESSTDRSNEKAYHLLSQTIYQLLLCSLLILGILVVRNMNIGNDLCKNIKSEMMKTVKMEEAKAVMDKCIKTISNYKL